MTFIWLFVLIFFKNKNKRTQDIFLYFLICILIIGEVLRYFVFLSNNINSFVNLAPFHLCGFIIFITIFAVFFRNKILMNLCYAFSFTTIFGVITPYVITFPPLSFMYIQGILSHGIMFLIAIFFIVDCGFRPELKYIPKMYAMLLAVTFLFIAPLDYVFKTNWFFIAWAPKETLLETLQNIFGWPGYVGVLLVLFIIIWVIMYLPFYLIQKTHKK
jgi:hypothetical integral membrane protein (TIGR02206 family)